MMLRVHILSKKLTYIKLKIVLCSLQDIHEFLDLSPQLPTLVQTIFRSPTFLFKVKIKHLYLLIRLQLRTRNKSQNPHNIQGLEMTTSWSVEVKINAVSLVLI